MLRTKRGRCEAPELRPKDRSSALTSLCFHCAFGFSQPNGSRTCKTPWSVFQDGSEGPPTYSRQRCGPRQRGRSLYETAQERAADGARQPGLSRAEAQLNSTRRHGPAAAVRRAKPRRRAVAGTRQGRAECLRISHPPEPGRVNLDLRDNFEEPLRLPLHSFTYC